MNNISWKVAHLANQENWCWHSFGQGELPQFVGGMETAVYMVE